MSQAGHGRPWVYLVIVVVGAAAAVGIAGVPSRHSDAPIHARTTTTTVAPAN